MVDYPRKKAEELVEALGHYYFFKNVVNGHEIAIKRMEVDMKMCRKNKEHWAKQVEKLGGTV